MKFIFNTINALISVGAFWLITLTGEGTASSAPTVLFVLGSFFAAIAVLGFISPCRSKYLS